MLVCYVPYPGIVACNQRTICTMPSVVGRVLGQFCWIGCWVKFGFGTAVGWSLGIRGSGADAKELLKDPR